MNAQTINVITKQVTSKISRIKDMVLVEKKSARDLKNLCILLENSAEGLWSMIECCWGCKSICDNTPEKLPHLLP